MGPLQLRADRVSRCGAPALSESVDVTMSEGPHFAEEATRLNILNALFVKFRTDEGAKAFDLGDPSPRGDFAHDAPDTGYFDISPLGNGGNAVVDSGRPRNVASDGDQQLCRRFTPGGRGGSSRPHRPTPFAGWRRFLPP